MLFGSPLLVEQSESFYNHVLPNRYVRIRHFGRWQTEAVRITSLYAVSFSARPQSPRKRGGSHGRSSHWGSAVSASLPVQFARKAGCSESMRCHLPDATVRRFSVKAVTRGFPLPRVLSSNDELPHCITGIEYVGTINEALEKYLYSLLMIHRCRMSVRRNGDLP